MKKHKGKRPRQRKGIPGPKAREWVKRDEKVISHSYTRQYPLVMTSGKGAWVSDVDGNRFLDFTAGIAVTATGHSHPKVVEAIVRQAKRFIHMSGTDFYYPSEVLLAEKLTSLYPGKGKGQVFFTNSGTESIEAAMKLARYHTGRPYFIAFLGGFHGRSMGALSLTASKAIHRKGFSPLIPGVLHAPYPYPYRPPADIKPEECDLYTIHFIRENLFRHLVAPEEVAAICVEAIQGEGGYIVPPKRFLGSLAKLAKEFGMLLIVDEIQAGMGRTGKMFSFEHFDVSPDIITLAKGLASGMPLGAMVAKTKIMSWESGSHANTFGGNPIACEAALATIDLLEKGLIANAVKVGDYLLSELQKMQRYHRLIGDIRGKGLMIGIELVRDRVTKEMAIPERNAILDRCFKKGLLLLGCGQTVLRMMPPLIVTRAEAETALTILDETLREVEKR